MRRTTAASKWCVVAFRRFHLIASKVNLGFAKANNLGLKRAGGRFLLLINPDTLVQEDTLRVMIRFFQENPDVGLAGCKVLNPDGTFQLACRRSFPRPWVAFSKMIGLSTSLPAFTPPWPLQSDLSQPR